MDKPGDRPILDMLKALADESRLSLLQLLNEGEFTVGDLSRQVELGEPTVSHHLAKLRAAGCVPLRMAGNQRFSRLYQTGPARFKQMAAEIEHLPTRPATAGSDDAWIAALGWNAADQQVLREHTQDRKISHLPGKQKKMLVLLRWLATLFKPDQLYSEPEVNEILRAVYAEDYVSLRRDLVDMGYLRRERGGGKYWLTAESGE